MDKITTVILVSFGAMVGGIIFIPRITSTIALGLVVALILNDDLGNKIRTFLSGLE